MCVCVSVWVCAVCKNRWEVEHPSNALLTLLSFFLCSLSDSVSVLLSLSVPPRWCKVEMTVSTGCFPLMDVLWMSLPPEALQIHTSNSPLLCSFHVSFLSPALIWVSPSFIWPLFSSFLQSAAVSSFVWFAVHTRKGGWDFCLTSVYFCSPRSPPRKTEGSALVSWEELSLPDTRITNQWQRGKGWCHRSLFRPAPGQQRSGAYLILGNKKCAFKLSLWK